MAKRQVTGYSRTQVALHWTVVVLVAFQFFAHDGIEDAWRAFVQGESAASDGAAVYLHIGAGVLVLLLALARIYLRIVRGAPSPPADEPRFLQVTAEAVHGSIYVLLLLLPFSGSAAWFFGVEAAGGVHAILTNLLLIAIALHVSGALYQHLVRRSQVMMRMLRPERS